MSASSFLKIETALFIAIVIGVAARHVEQSFNSITRHHADSGDSSNSASSKINLFTEQTEAIMRGHTMQEQTTTTFRKEPSFEEQAHHFADEVRAMKANPRFQELAKRVVAQMETILANPTVDVHSQEQAQHVAEQLKMTLEDPKLHESAKRMSEQMKAMMSDTHSQECIHIAAQLMNAIVTDLQHEEVAREATDELTHDVTNKYKFDAEAQAAKVPGSVDNLVGQSGYLAWDSTGSLIEKLVDRTLYSLFDRAVSLPPLSRNSDETALRKAGHAITLRASVNPFRARRRHVPITHQRLAAVRGADVAPRPGSIAEAILVQGKKPYGEGSRQYRRTIYRFEDWLEHRSETRLLRNLKGIFTSGVVRSLLSEVAAVALMSAIVIVVNDSEPSWPIQLPIAIFTLSSPALGLLLVFRTNASYSRWKDARMAWGRIIAHSRNIMRQAAAWVDHDEPTSRAALEELNACVWLFPFTLWRHLSDPTMESQFVAEVHAAIGSEAADVVLNTTHRPLRALSLLSAKMKRLPIAEKAKIEMDKSCVLLGEACETCERIFASPVPLVYTRHTARFLASWLLLLPLGLWDSFKTSWHHTALLPVSTLIAIFFFGIEELAVQLEEPFSILPLESLCSDLRRVGADTIELMSGRGTSSVPQIKVSDDFKAHKV